MRTLLFFLLAALAMSTPAALAQSCNPEPKCTAMRNCAEADYYFRQCGHTARDGDSDGIPCEALCGKTMEEYLRRRAE